VPSFVVTQYFEFKSLSSTPHPSIAFGKRRGAEKEVARNNHGGLWRLSRAYQSGIGWFAGCAATHHLRVQSVLLASSSPYTRVARCKANESRQIQMSYHISHPDNCLQYRDGFVVSCCFDRCLCLSLGYVSMGSCRLTSVLLKLNFLNVCHDFLGAVIASEARRSQHDT
jgi:hypothetical protein